MKSFIFSLLLIFSSCLLYAQLQNNLPPQAGPTPDVSTLLLQSPSNENFPTPENILVVYKTSVSSDSISEKIANYYQNKRGIPTVNMKRIDIPQSYTYPEGVVTLFDNGEDIRGEGNLGWRYTYDVIAAPIQNYLNNTIVNGQPLKNRIKYIVFCKGIPHKIRYLPYDDITWKSRYRWHASVGALLCLINQPDNRNFLQLYNTYVTSHNNPLYGVDANATMNYRFKSNHFVNAGGWYTQYLVSWLNGDTYSDVIAMIDRSATPNYSGQKTWIIDDDPYAYWNNFSTSNNILIGKGFTTVFDNTTTWLTSTQDQVIGYLSNGVHTTNPMPPTYIRDILAFNYANGANFLSWESFNGFSFGVSRAGQGLISDFIFKNGTGGSGHVYEPYTDGVTQDYYTMPAYSMGYSIVDAQYQGIYYNAWRNIVVGDPLTTIAWGKQSLTSNLNWNGTNLVTGEIDISDLKTLTIANNSVINLRHQGFITGDGKLILGQNVTFNLYSWQKGLFLSYDSDNPRLVWGAHPTLGPGTNYKVYRKVGEENNWELITTTTALEYTDTQMQFSIVLDQLDNLFYKVVAFSEMPGTYESNIVACTGNKAPKKIISNQTTTLPVEYSLEQNYPNPFNPTTQINYSIKEAGLVQIKTFDILGKEVATLVNENKEAGNYRIDFNAAELPSGVYIYQLSTPGFTKARKMILAK